MQSKNSNKRVIAILLYVGAIFAVPAIVAALFGSYLDNKYSTAPLYSAISFVVAFVLSWLTVIRLYIKETKKLETKTDEKNGMVKSNTSNKN